MLPRLVMAVTLLALALTARAAVAEADALPTGTWTLLGTDFIGSLVVTAVDAEGNIDGSTGGQPIVGTWNAQSNRISWAVQIGSGGLGKTLVHVGHLFSVAVGPDTTYILAGTVTGFPPAGFPLAQAERAWVAIITPPQP